MTIKLPRTFHRLTSTVAIATAITIGNVIHAGAADAKDELSVDQVIATLKNLGYSDISDVEREDDRYCADVRDADGKKLEVHVSAQTGEIVGKERKDD